MNAAGLPSQVGFLHQVGVRLRALWAVKALGVSLGMTVFFIAYFRLLNHPLFPVTIVPLTAVDRLIGFHPESLPLYLSLWIYVPLPFTLLLTYRELRSYGLATAILSGIGLGIFLFWPTAVPTVARDWGAHSAFAFLKAVDASGNACPSLHVAFAVFTAIRLDERLRMLRAGTVMRTANALWGLGIVYSTLATGQHVALDALAGSLLGALVAALPLGRTSVALDAVPANPGC